MAPLAAFLTLREAALEAALWLLESGDNFRRNDRRTAALDWATAHGKYETAKVLKRHPAEHLDAEFD